MSEAAVTVIYDGECPVCRNYSQAVTIAQTAGGLETINARDGGALVDDVLARGFDLDEGFVVRIGDEFYHGAEAMHRLALISGQNGLLNRLNYWVFRSPTRSKWLYPGLRLGRNTLLALLGKSKFSQG